MEGMCLENANLRQPGGADQIPKSVLKTLKTSAAVTIGLIL